MHLRQRLALRDRTRISALLSMAMRGALGAAVFLGACNEELQQAADIPARTGAGTEVVDDSLVVTGQLESWTEGTGYSLEAGLGTPTEPLTVLATSPIDERGRFSIRLPSAAVMRAHQVRQTALDSFCPRSAPGITFSPDPLAAIYMSFQTRKANVLDRVRHAQSVTTTGMQSLTVNTTESLYVFSFSPGRASGTAACSSGDGFTQHSFDVGLVPGWNVLVQRGQTVLQTGMPSSSSIETKSDPAPVDLLWTD